MDSSGRDREGRWIGGMDRVDVGRVDMMETVKMVIIRVLWIVEG